MPSEVPVDRCEGFNGLQFVGQAYLTHALLDSSSVSMLANSYGGYPPIEDIRLQCFHGEDGRSHPYKQKFSTHGAPKQMYMLFQNDILIDVVCQRYTLNIQVSSGTKNNSSPNEPSCTTVTVSFNGVLLVVTGTWRSPY
ncbi:uncharacterized protein TNCV_4988821 [Trichonephila clavipes]|nr:uncharacterized protein TNCV_4988821 [Trichonephila clavipes]